MNKKSGSGTAMFMMEMIMVVFFFILCASTCILVFARANSMSRLAKDTNQGVVAAESVVEVWKAEGCDGVVRRFAAVAEQPDVRELPEGSCTIYWDAQWNITAESGPAAYSGKLCWNSRDGLDEAEVAIVRLDDRTALYTLAAKKYQGGRE